MLSFDFVKVYFFALKCLACTKSTALCLNPNLNFSMYANSASWHSLQRCVQWLVVTETMKFLL